MTAEMPEMAALTERFRVRCRSDLEFLRSLGISESQVRAGGMEQVGAVAHRISGSGGIFGFPELSDAAALVETLLIAPEGPDPAKVVRAYGALIERLEQVIAD